MSVHAIKPEERIRQQHQPNFSQRYGRPKGQRVVEQDSDDAERNPDGEKFLCDSPIVPPADVHRAAPIPPRRWSNAGNSSRIPMCEWLVRFAHRSSLILKFEIGNSELLAFETLRRLTNLLHAISPEP